MFFFASKQINIRLIFNYIHFEPNIPAHPNLHYKRAKIACTLLFFMGTLPLHFAETDIRSTKEERKIIGQNNDERHSQRHKPIVQIPSGLKS